MMKLYRLEDLTPGQVLNRDLRAEQDVEAVVAFAATHAFLLGLRTGAGLAEEGSWQI